MLPNVKLRSLVLYLCLAFIAVALIEPNIILNLLNVDVSRLQKIKELAVQLREQQELKKHLDAANAKNNQDQEKSWIPESVRWLADAMMADVDTNSTTDNGELAPEGPREEKDSENHSEASKSNTTAVSPSEKGQDSEKQGEEKKEPQKQATKSETDQNAGGAAKETDTKNINNLLSKDSTTNKFGSIELNKQQGKGINDAPKPDAAESNKNTESDKNSMSKSETATKSSPSASANGSKSPDGWVTCQFKGGRLGSTMFAYASLYGIATLNNKTPFLSTKNNLWKDLAKYFEGFTLVQSRDQPISINHNAHEAGRAHSVHGNIIKLPPGKNVHITGFLQAFRYFAHVKDIVRKEMHKFKPEVKEPCLKRLRETLGLKDGETTECLVIGIHCRRGDFEKPDKKSFGHWPAQPEYVKKAMQKYREKFSSAKCLRFLVYSNGYEWAKQSFGNFTDVKCVEQSENPAVDMCMLGQSNHSIITTGTYSWWSGFLTGGHVLYQREYARPGSSLSHEYTKTDYFPPEWEECC